MTTANNTGMMWELVESAAFVGSIGVTLCFMLEQPRSGRGGSG